MILEEAGNSISIDEFIDQLKKTGFGRILVEIDAALPLKPWVLIKKKNRIFRHSFVYENLLVVCFHCS